VTAIDHFVPQAKATPRSAIIAPFIKSCTDDEDVILDPFCRSSDIVWEAIGADRRVIAVSFDPLDVLRIRLDLSPIPQAALAAAFTRLADSPKQDRTLRRHLLDLYTCTCPECKAEATALQLVWDPGSKRPGQLTCRCPACGATADLQCDDADRARAEAVDPRGFHYWYVIDRVAPEDERTRKLTMQLLEAYTPRNLYALASLTRRIEDLFAGSPVLDWMQLALLQCLEQAATFEPRPLAGGRLGASPPASPVEAVERNVWLLFEAATQSLSTRTATPGVPLAPSLHQVFSGVESSSLPLLARQPSAYVGRMTTRELARQLPSNSIRLIWTHPPKLGREHWGRRWLWAGWLFGHEAAASLLTLAQQRHPNWSWYLQAVRTILSSLKRALTADGRITCWGEERGLAYYEAMCLAAAGSALYLETALYQPAQREVATAPFGGLQGDYVVTWGRGAAAPPWPIALQQIESRAQEIAADSAAQVLQRRAEPAAFARLHCHIYEGLAQQGVLSRIVSSEEVKSPLEHTRHVVQAALRSEVGRTLVQLWESEEQGTCWWWLAEPPQRPSLSQRVEEELLDLLRSVDCLPCAELLHRLYQRFPGVLTPDLEWVVACLRSYSSEIGDDTWMLRPTETEGNRTRRRLGALERLEMLAHRMGARASWDSHGADIEWTLEDQEHVAFIWLDSAAVSRLLALQRDGGVIRPRRVAVVTSERLELVRLRLRRSLWIRRPLAEQGWQFISEMDLEDWGKRAEVTLADLDSFVGLDLLATEDLTQLSLI